MSVDLLLELLLLLGWVVVSRACALLANKGPMSVRANSRSLVLLPLGAADDELLAVVFAGLSAESDSDESELSSEELL